MDKKSQHTPNRQPSHISGSTLSERYEAHQAKLGEPVTKADATKSAGMKLTKSYNRASKLTKSLVPTSGHMNYQSGLLSEKSGIHCELRTTEVGGPKPVSNVRDDKSGITLGLPLPTTDILLTGKDGSPVLKFDTQADMARLSIGRGLELFVQGSLVN